MITVTVTVTQRRLVILAGVGCNSGSDCSTYQPPSQADRQYCPAGHAVFLSNSCQQEQHTICHSSVHSDRSATSQMKPFVDGLFCTSSCAPHCSTSDSNGRYPGLQLLTGRVHLSCSFCVRQCKHCALFFHMYYHCACGCRMKPLTRWYCILGCQSDHHTQTPVQQQQS